VPKEGDSAKEKKDDLQAKAIAGNMTGRSLENKAFSGEPGESLGREN